MNDGSLRIQHRRRVNRFVLKVEFAGAAIKEEDLERITAIVREIVGPPATLDFEQELNVEQTLYDSDDEPL